jgi:uncharacterized membrane protein YbaN (DUF454 family)
MRHLFFILGWFFFLLGFIGIFLPVAPTTPFMLLALWAFARSSERFHNWLYNHPVLGPPLQQWHQYRVIPPAAKILSVSFMSISVISLSLFSPMANWLKWLVALSMLLVAIFILSMPSRPPQGADKIAAKQE